MDLLCHDAALAVRVGSGELLLHTLPFIQSKMFLAALVQCAIGTGNLEMTVLDTCFNEGFLTVWPHGAALCCVDGKRCLKQSKYVSLLHASSELKLFTVQ